MIPCSLFPNHQRIKSSSLRQTDSAKLARLDGAGVWVLSLQGFMKGSLFYNNEEFKTLLLQTWASQKSSSMILLYPRHECHYLGNKTERMSDHLFGFSD
jgi:hypothetical protein